MNYTRYLLICAIASCLGCRTERTMLPPAQPLAREQLFGSWIGFDSQFSHFYRLDLNPDGSAALISFYTKTNVRTYEATAWNLHDNRLSFSIARPAGVDLEGKTAGVIIDLVLRDREWQDSIKLRREAEIKAFLQRAAGGGDKSQALPPRKDVDLD